MMMHLKVNTTNNSLQLCRFFINEDCSYFKLNGFLQMKRSFQLTVFSDCFGFQTLMFSLLKEWCQDQLIARLAPAMLQEGHDQSCLWSCLCPDLGPVPQGVCLLDGLLWACTMTCLWLKLQLHVCPTPDRPSLTRLGPWFIHLPRCCGTSPWSLKASAVLESHSTPI